MVKVNPVNLSRRTFRLKIRPIAKTAEDSDPRRFGPHTRRFYSNMKNNRPEFLSTIENEEQDSSQSIEEKPVKIDKWDSAALKNALDDGAKKVMLEKFGFMESHRLMDGRLAICTIAVSFAAFALIWDYFRPFPESRPVLITCVVSYFILMGVLTAYTTYFEKGIFLVALDKDRTKVDPDNRWELSSSLKKYDDTYTLSMAFTDGKSNKTRSGEIQKSVAEYFDEDGRFCFDLFEPQVRMLQNRIATSKKE